MPGDDLNNPTARATNWARAQIDRRREMEERQEAWDKAHPMAHPWQVDPHLPPGGVRLGFWFFVESLPSMSSTEEMSRRLRIQFEGAIYHVMTSASPSPTDRSTPGDHG